MLPDFPSLRTLLLTVWYLCSRNVIESHAIKGNRLDKELPLDQKLIPLWPQNIVAYTYDCSLPRFTMFGLLVANLATPCAEACNPSGRSAIVFWTISFFISLPTWDTPLVTLPLWMRSAYGWRSCGTTSVIAFSAVQSFLQHPREV